MLNKGSIIFLLLIGQYQCIYLQCNGSANLCNKRFNEVAYLTTHNAFNSSQGNFSLPNQNLNIVSQLNDGVRGLMIDVYDSFGTPTVYHGSPILGSQPFIDYLNQIHSFLTNHPNEIVTIILECYTDANSIEDVINQSGLNNFLYTYNPIDGWPTLQTMIDNNERLVIFSDEDDANPSQQWYHYVWDFAVETHYSVNNQNDFTCDYNRGDSLNDLFIFNHFVTTPLGTGDQNASNAANSNPFFINRVLQCQQEKNKFPNFITVDFYELGNSMDVVNQLNELINSINERAINLSQHVKVFPNPAKDKINIETNKVIKLPFSVAIINNIGKQLAFFPSINNHYSTIENDLPKGIHYILIQDSKAKLYTTKVIIQ